MNIFSKEKRNIICEFQDFLLNLPPILLQKVNYDKILRNLKNKNKSYMRNFDNRFSVVLVLILGCFLLLGCKPTLQKDVDSNKEGFYVEVTIADTAKSYIDSLSVKIKANSPEYANSLKISDVKIKKNPLVKWIDETFYQILEKKEVPGVFDENEKAFLSIVVVFTILVLINLFYFLLHRAWRRFLRWGAVLTLLLGYIIYYIGFFTDGTATTFGAYVVRPLIASLGMFVANTSYQEVCVECISSTFYMLCFGLVHLMAITISAFFVISFLGKRLLFFFRRLWWRIAYRHRTINIFFGFNEASVTLAKSIYTETKNKEKERIVFVDFSSKDDQYKSQLSLSELLGLFPYKKEFLSQISDIGYVLLSADNDVAAIKNDKDILANLGLYFLRWAVKHAKETRIFLLSEDEKANINSILNLANDKVFNKKRNVKLYCHARRTLENLALQGFEHIEVYLIDSSYLSVASLKLKEEDNTLYIGHPVNYVTTDCKGHVTSPFNAMIVGFGETGQEMLKFIYEFGSFLNSGNKKSAFKCYCFDERMSQIESTFKLSVPGIKDNREIEYRNVAYQSKEFWEEIEKHIDDLNYVVVSVGDDEASLALAVQIYDYANRYRRNGFERFHIFVRSYQDECLSKVEQTKNVYNQMAKFDSSSVAIDGNLECGRTEENVITIFGTREEIFSYKVIIDNEIKKMGDEFNATYESLVPYEEMDHLTKTQSNVYLKKQNNRRKELQNFNNALHIYTKSKLVGGYEKMCELPQSNYIFDDKSLYETLAETEHLRWNSSHIMLGYTPMDKAMKDKMDLQNMTSNEQLKQHCCLVDYCSLSEKYKDYDRGVIRTTLKMLLEKINNQ